MKEITKEKLIKDQRYFMQLACYSIFFIAAMAVLILELLFFSGLNFNSIFQLSIVVLFIVIPFGYILGMKKMMKTIKNILFIKKGCVSVKEKQVVDKTMVHADSSNKFCQIVFSENDGIWISKQKDREINKGDVCYVLYIGKSQEPSAVYTKKKYCLSDDLIKKEGA